MRTTWRISGGGGASDGGPYTEEDLLDLIEAGGLSPDTVCENVVTGRRCRAGELFQVIPAAEPSAPAPVREVPRPEPAPWRPVGLPAMEEEVDDANGLRREPVRPVYAGHPALLTFWRSLSVGVLLLAGGWFAGRWNGLWLGAGILAGGLWTAAVLLVRSCREYLVDTRRVESREGILAKSSREIRVQDIRAINVSKSGLYGVLGIGTVEFASAGSGDQDVTFRDVAGADAIKAAVRRLQD